MLLEGQQLKRYRLAQLIASGGMGEIYLAEDTNLNRQVAIKIIRPEMVSYADADAVGEAVRLFKMEAMAIAQLDHPCILPLFDCGEETINGIRFTYMVMPLRQEGSLAIWKQRHRRLGMISLAEIAHILSQAASALQHAHDRGIIHRDVKPSNFLIVSGKNQPDHLDVQLADFGVAKFMNAISSKSQTIRGTPIYMAPEQWRGDAVPATDQYALAVMVYELLTGRPPFQGTNQQEIFYKHTYVQPEPPSRLNPHIPVGTDAVLMRALAKDPKDRYAAVVDFAQAFQQALRKAEATVILSNTRFIEESVPVLDDVTVDGRSQRPSKTRIFLLLGPILLLVLSGFGLLAYSTFASQSTNPTPPNNAAATHHAETVIAQVNATATSSTNATATQTYLTASHATATVQANFTATASVLAATATVSAQDTATAQANLTATAVAYTATVTAGNLKLKDALQDNTQGNNWDVTSIAGGGGCAFINGAYHSSMPQRGYFSPCFALATNFANFSYQIEMTFVKGDQGGIAFRADAAKGAFYYFYINRNGIYALQIYNNNLLVGTLTTGSSPAIKTGLNQSNVLAVVAEGSSIDLYVNMQHIASVSDSTYTQGQIGVVTEDINNPTDLAFSNASVYSR